MKLCLRFLILLVILVGNVSCSTEEPVEIQTNTNETIQVNVGVANTVATIEYSSVLNEGHAVGEIVSIKLFGQELDHVGDLRFKGSISINTDEIEPNGHTFLEKIGYEKADSWISPVRSMAGGSVTDCSIEYLGNSAEDALPWFLPYGENPGDCYKYYMETCVTVTEIVGPDGGTIMSAEFSVWVYATSRRC